MPRKETPKLTGTEGMAARRQAIQAAASQPEDTYQPSQRPAQPVTISVPRGYDQKVWALAMLFEDGARFQDVSAGAGLPLMHDRIMEAVHLHMDSRGFFYLASATMHLFWGGLPQLRNGSATEHGDPWLTQYITQFPVLWERVTQEQARATMEQRLAEKRAESRALLARGIHRDDEFYANWGKE